MHTFWMILIYAVGTLLVSTLIGAFVGEFIRVGRGHCD